MRPKALLWLQYILYWIFLLNLPVSLFRSILLVYHNDCFKLTRQSHAGIVLEWLLIKLFGLEIVLTTSLSTR